MLRFSISVFICLLLLPICAAGQVYMTEPEGLAFDSLNNRFLVSSWGARKIIAVDEAGVQTPFKTGLGNCAGMHIVGNTVYVAINNNRIEGFDLTTAERVFLCNISTSGCHDIASDSSGFLYATDWNGQRIFRIDPTDSSWSVLASTGIVLPGGVHFDPAHNRLIVTSMNDGTPIKAVYLSDTSIVDICDRDFPGLDGITDGPPGFYYISTLIWGLGHANTAYLFDTGFTATPILIADSIMGLADVCYSPQWKVLAISSYEDDRVDFLPIKSMLNIDSYNLLDDASGDGDGIPEPGETIDVEIIIGNDGPFDAESLELTFTCEDQRLTVSDGFMSAGTLAIGDSVDNIAQPFHVAIPGDYAARLDSFFIDAVWTESGDPCSERLSFTESIGRPTVLLIDDDGNDTLEQYYLDCFATYQIAVDVWTMPPASGAVVPDSSDLNRYDVVVWFSGDFPQLFYGATIDAMQGYLDGGGNLFLTGQGIADMLDMSYPDFMHDYLHCDFLSSGYSVILAATGSGVICPAGDSLAIFGTPGADNQVNPGRVEAVNGAVGEFAYTGTTDFGAISYSGDYKLVFFAFGFEAIQNENDRWVDQPTVLQAVLEFFEFAWPAAPPETTLLDLSPGDAMYLTEHAPDILWTYADPADRPQEAYRIQVGDDDDWSASEMWDSGPVAGASPQGAYGGTSLEDGAVYHLRVRTSNGILWSPWTERQFRMNSVPLPTGLSPDDSTETSEGSPLLTHDTMTDAEGSPLTYDYEVYDDAGLSVLVASAAAVAPGPDPVQTWTVTAVLPEDEDYFWRVRCQDGYEPGTWSPAAVFMVVPAYVCGDANGDEAVNVGDAVYIINYAFKGGPPPEIIEAGDANGDGACDVGDAVYLINYSFKGGPEPLCP